MDNTPGFCYTLFVLLRDVFSCILCDLKTVVSFILSLSTRTTQEDHNSELASIRNITEILPQSQFFLVYQAPVESNPRYGNLMWGHLPEKKLCSLQKIQISAFTS